MTKSKPFSGRVIFDHLGKTGGMAVTSWLMESLGSGTITETLVSSHSELIRKYGGLFPILSSHITFDVGLDPRYQYVTMLRDPIDRVSSWLFYADNTVPNAPEFVTHKKAAGDFLRSDGKILPRDLISSVSNYYVDHFSQIQKFSGKASENKINSALVALKEYEIVGLYEQFPQFLSEFSDLIGLPAPQSIARINVTTQRPSVNQLSVTLRERLIELNQQDLHLYNEVVAWRASMERSGSKESFSLASPLWQKYELTRNRIFTTEDICIISASMREGYDIKHGERMTFDVDFFLIGKVESLEVGIHLFDSNHQWAFGINSSLLEQSHKLLPSGLYRASYFLLADLPAGKYTAGFAMANHLADGHKQELAWYDVMCEFQINHPERRVGVGYANMASTIRLKKIPIKFNLKADDIRLHTEVGVRRMQSICTTNKAGYLLFGPYISLPPGDYLVGIHLESSTLEFGGASMDVAVNKGRNILFEDILSNHEKDSKLILKSFSLNNMCNDLEIRVWVDSVSNFSISRLDIQAL